MRARLLTHGPFIATIALVALVVAACGGDDASTSDGGVTTLSPAQVEAGENLYQTNCGWCHGYDLRGTERAPSHLSALYGSESSGDEVFRAAIANGAQQKNWTFGDMPPVPALSADEVETIIRYVRHMHATEGLEPYPADDK